MKYRASRLGSLLVILVAGAAAAAACGGGGDSNTTTSSTSAGHGGSPGTGGTGNQGTGGDTLTLFDGGHTGGTAQQGFDVQPATPQTITVALGQQTPTVAYTATLDGMPANAGWGVDRGNVATIAAGPASSAVLAPTGNAGGLVTVSAGLNGKTVTRQVMVKLTGTQDGPNTNSPLEQAQIPATVADLTSGGGVGGVGGEGLGVAVGDAATLAALGSPSGNGSAEGLTWLYPYDKTVWPRGLLAPLLQWDWAPGDADAIQIELSTTTGSFSWKGTFGRPAILAQTGGKFIRHPIPQDVWRAATDTAGGSTDQLTVKLTVARGGQAYGPISETWTIAPARLSGIIYYNSYGTELAHNYGGFGGAVLSIHVGDTGPRLVAGNDTDCRTCHSVAAFGSRLVAMPYGNYSAYDLSPNGAVENPMPNSGAWFPGIYPDGSMMLTGDGTMLPLPNGGSPIPATGLGTTTPDMSAFSPDGKLVAYNPGVGPTLSVMSFDRTTNAFSNEVVVVDDSTNGLTPGWPAFYPDGKSVIFEQETAPSALDGHNDGILWTREGARGYLAWTSAAGGGAVTPLDQLNGTGYLPKLAAPYTLSCLGDSGYQEGYVGGADQHNADHSDDANMNYEPTVAPVAAGGYAWVVFTSRRMYGSVAKIPPFCSDPRGVDLISNITPKKLWVAAVDISGQPTIDASHPAFYLPAQEILAGNSRGFWVLDPCRPDGEGCEHGDECCNGYCQPNGAGGALVCSNTPPQGHCSAPQEKCATATDCCDPSNICMNGFCTQKGPA